MRHPLVVIIVALALVAAACGNDTGTDTSVGERPDNGSTPDNGTAPGGEPPLGAGPYPIADLTVTVQLDPDTDPAGYRLACLGDTATVSGEVSATAESLCLALDESPARDRLVNGVPDDQVCTMQFGGPEIATFTGTIDGVPVDTEVARRDGCGIADWASLSPLLPPR